MSKIIFINPPLSTAEGYGYFSANAVAPLGICYLAAVTRQAKYDTRIVDGIALRLSIKNIVEIITREKPRYVGITATSRVIDIAGHLAQKIKDSGLDCKIIVGGPHMSAVPEDTLADYTAVDIGIIGEGEVTIVEILNALETRMSLRDVKGVIFRDGQDIHRTESRVPVKDLDILPFPAWDLLYGFPAKYRPAPQYFLNLPSGTLVTSRGCPAKCIFCGKSVYQRLYSRHSSDYVVRAIKHLVNTYRVRDIFFFDDTFLLDTKRVAEICENLLNDKIHISWSCFARAVDIKDQNLLRLMRKSGCYQISLGVESADQRILDILQKQVTVEKTEQAINLLNSCKIRPHGFFIVGNPGETRDSLDRTISFIKRTKLNSIQVSFFTPYPGSVAYDTVNKYGTMAKSNIKGTNLWTPSFIPAGLTQRELIQYYNMAVRSFYFNPVRILRYLWRAISRPAYFTSYLSAGVSVVKQLWGNSKLANQNESRLQTPKVID